MHVRRGRGAGVTRGVSDEPGHIRRVPHDPDWAGLDPARPARGGYEVVMGGDEAFSTMAGSRRSWRWRAVTGDSRRPRGNTTSWPIPRTARPRQRAWQASCRTRCGTTRYRHPGVARASGTLDADARRRPSSLGMWRRAAPIVRRIAAADRRWAVRPLECVGPVRGEVCPGDPLFERSRPDPRASARCCARDGALALGHDRQAVDLFQKAATLCRPPAYLGLHYARAQAGTVRCRSSNGW
jgi:hypothetical protein